MGLGLHSGPLSAAKGAAACPLRVGVWGGTLTPCLSLASRLLFTVSLPLSLPGPQGPLPGASSEALHTEPPPPPLPLLIPSLKVTQADFYSL